MKNPLKFGGLQFATLLLTTQQLWISNPSFEGLHGYARMAI